MKITELEKFALEIRIEIVKSIAKKGGGHIGGSLSIADLVSVLYEDVMNYSSEEPNWSERDYLICSKGHAGPALYSALALKGFFPMEWLDTLNIEGTMLPGHCDRLKVPGIDATTGSLGQGLSIAAGIAHGFKLRDKDQRVFCITGDGEHAEGQIWEAVTFASHNKLNQLINFLDWNKKQIDGTNDEVMALGDVKKKYEAFGWHAVVVDGSNVKAIRDAILYSIENVHDKPSLIVLDVVKGSGVPTIEKIEFNHCIGVPREMEKESLGYLLEEYSKYQ